MPVVVAIKGVVDDKNAPIACVAAVPRLSPEEEYAKEREPLAYVQISPDVEVGNATDHNPLPEPIRSVPEAVEEAKETLFPT